MVLVIAITIIIGIGAIIGSFYFPYVLLKPYLATKSGQRMILKGFLILATLSIISAVLALHFINGPDFFSEGIEQLRSSAYVKSKIGDFSSYSYDSNKFPQDPTKSAVFQVELRGDSINLYLTCTMKKANIWKLIEIHQDSIVKSGQP